MEKTLKEAVKWSLVKWNYIYNNNGSEKGLIEANTELASLKYECGLCEMFDNSTTPCAKCPLVINGKVCRDIPHPWIAWYIHKTKDDAKAVLDLIKAIKI